MKRLLNIYNKMLKLFLTPNLYAKSIGVNLGKNVYLSTKNFSSEPYLINIGDNCRIAKDVCFFTHGGLYTLRNYNEKLYNQLEVFGDIHIGNNVYLGQGCYIMPGVIIGSNSIIGAGSIVTRDIPENMLAVGNPAKVISSIDDFGLRMLQKGTQKSRKDLSISEIIEMAKRK